MFDGYPLAIRRGGGMKKEVGDKVKCHVKLQ
jgi:hypothetical protein